MALGVGGTAVYAAGPSSLKQVLVDLAKGINSDEVLKKIVVDLIAKGIIAKGINADEVIRLWRAGKNATK